MGITLAFLCLKNMMVLVKTGAVKQGQMTWYVHLAFILVPF